MSQLFAPATKRWTIWEPLQNSNSVSRPQDMSVQQRNCDQYPATLLAALTICYAAEKESNKSGAQIPKTFRDHAHGEMLEVLRLNLMELPDEVVDEECIERISCLFVKGIFNQHMPFYWSAHHNQPDDFLLWFLLVIVLTSMAYLFYRFCVKNPATLYKRLFRPQTNRCPWSRIPQDDSTDLSVRFGNGQTDISQSLGAPLSFNSIFELNEAAILPALMSETPRRDSSMGMVMRGKGVLLPQANSFSLVQKLLHTLT